MGPQERRSNKKHNKFKENLVYIGDTDSRHLCLCPTEAKACGEELNEQQCVLASQIGLPWKLPTHFHMIAHRLWPKKCQHFIWWSSSVPHDECSP